MLTNAVNAELLHSGCGAPDAIRVPLPDCGAEVGVRWLLLPEGRMLCNHPARHLIRILRQRVEKAEEASIPANSAESERPGRTLQDAAGRG